MTPLVFEARGALLQNHEGFESARAALRAAAQPVTSSLPNYTVTRASSHGVPRALPATERCLDWSCPDTLLSNGRGLACARLALGHVANGLDPNEAAVPVRATSPRPAPSPLSTNRAQDTIAMLQTAREALDCVAEELDRENDAPPPIPRYEGSKTPALEERMSRFLEALPPSVAAVESHPKFTSRRQPLEDSLGEERPAPDRLPAGPAEAMEAHGTHVYLDSGVGWRSQGGATGFAETACTKGLGTHTRMLIELAKLGGAFPHHTPESVAAGAIPDAGFIQSGPRCEGEVEVLAAL
jgi:hypothetical protein